METEVIANDQGLMTIEAVQKVVNRSRASVYRYTNTDFKDLNPPYSPKRLNPELRQSKDDLLLFHPSEVARFSRDVLGLKQVTIEVRESAETTTQELLRAILAELQDIRCLLAQRDEPDA